MLQPLTDRFSAGDDSLADWNPLDYNPLWTQGPQSPFGQMYDKDADVQHGTAGESWSQMPAVDSQHRVTMNSSQCDRQTSGRPPEQVVLQWYCASNSGISI